MIENCERDKVHFISVILIGLRQHYPIGDINRLFLGCAAEIHEQVAKPGYGCR